MKCNVGGADRAFRTLFGAIILLVGYFGIFSTAMTVTLYAVAAVALITGLFRFCPLYLIFGVNTCEPPMKQRLSSR